jgi:hypothetical protein
MCQVPSRYWSQYSNWGLEHPDAVAVRWTVTPAACAVVAGERVAEEHGGGGLTTSVAGAVLVRPPPVPVMVSGYEPGAVDVVLVTVKVEAAAGAGLGLKAPAAPEGKPLTVRVTPLLKPLTLAMLTVYVVVPPWTMVWLLGVALNEKSGGGGALTTSVALAVWVRLPFVPLIVTG